MIPMVTRRVSHESLNLSISFPDAGPPEPLQIEEHSERRDPTLYELLCFLKIHILAVLICFLLIFCWLTGIVEIHQSVGPSLSLLANYTIIASLIDLTCTFGRSKRKVVDFIVFLKYFCIYLAIFIMNHNVLAKELIKEIKQ